MVFGYTPAGFEDYFRAIGVRPGEPWKGLTGTDWSRINAEFGITYRESGAHFFESREDAVGWLGAA